MSGVLERSLFSTSTHFSLRFRKKNQETSGFSVVVSKKIEKTAVRRNLLKRRVYEAIQKLLPHQTEVVQGVVFAKKGSNKLSFKEIEEEIKTLFKKAKLIS